MDLFEDHAIHKNSGARPLAERMRPQCLDDMVGQTKWIGAGAPIRAAIEGDRLFSMLLWGPPGCGKTTLARIVALETQSHFVEFSAVFSGVKDIRATIAEAKSQLVRGKRTILFVDEIHRFNKAQQDGFLRHVENGLITLIGATTENPSFEVISALLSRCRVVVLEPINDTQMAEVLDRAMGDAALGLGRSGLTLAESALDQLVAQADGDLRTALNALEWVADSTTSAGGTVIDADRVAAGLAKRALIHDKSGESHYNIISALHKSIRGSDPDAAVYWLVRMLEAGDDPLYLARRLVRCATEDIGLADPYALTVALSAMEAFRFLGNPEGQLALIEAAVYLATAPKSNRLYVAHKAAVKAIEDSGSQPVPLHIRNAPTGLMRELGYGRGYQYDHDHPDAVAPQSYLPEGIANQHFYEPTGRGYEQTIAKRLTAWRKKKAAPPSSAEPAE